MEFTNTQDIIDGYLRGRDINDISKNRHMASATSRSQSTSSKTQRNSSSSGAAVLSPLRKHNNKFRSSNSLIDDITVFDSDESDRDSLDAHRKHDIEDIRLDYQDDDLDRFLQLDNSDVDELLGIDDAHLYRGNSPSKSLSINLPSPSKYWNTGAHKRNLSDPTVDRKSSNHKRNTSNQEPNQELKKKDLNRTFDEDIERILSMGQTSALPDFDFGKSINKEEDNRHIFVDDDQDEIKLLQQTHKAILSLPSSIRSNREFERYEHLLDSSIDKLVKQHDKYRQDCQQLQQSNEQLQRDKAQAEAEGATLRNRYDQQVKKCVDLHDRLTSLSKRDKEREREREREKSKQQQRDKQREAELQREKDRVGSSNLSQLMKENELLRQKLVKYKGLYDELKNSKGNLNTDHAHPAQPASQAAEVAPEVPEAPQPAQSQSNWGNEEQINNLILRLAQVLSQATPKPAPTSRSAPSSSPDSVAAASEPPSPPKTTALSEDSSEPRTRLKMLEIFEQAFEQMKEEAKNVETEGIKPVGLETKEIPRTAHQDSQPSSDDMIQQMIRSIETLSSKLDGMGKMGTAPSQQHRAEPKAEAPPPPPQIVYCQCHVHEDDSTPSVLKDHYVPHDNDTGTTSMIPGTSVASSYSPQTTHSIHDTHDTSECQVCALAMRALELAQRKRKQRQSAAAHPTRTVSTRGKSHRRTGKKPTRRLYPVSRSTSIGGSSRQAKKPSDKADAEEYYSTESEDGGHADEQQGRREHTQTLMGQYRWNKTI